MKFIGSNSRNKKVSKGDLGACSAISLFTEKNFPISYISLEIFFMLLMLTLLCICSHHKKLPFFKHKHITSTYILRLEILAMFDLQILLDYHGTLFDVI